MIEDKDIADKILGEEINLKMYLSPPQRTIVVNAMLKFKNHYNDKDNRNTRVEDRRQ
jgi:hypothetical protein